MKFNAVAWFEIPVEDMDRAKAFYEAVFLEKLSDLEMPGMEMAVWNMDAAASGAAGALIKQEGMRPSAAPGLMVYFHSENVEIELGRVAGAGGRVFQEKTSIGDHGFIGSFIDTEGNLVSVHSRA